MQTYDLEVLGEAPGGGTTVRHYVHPAPSDGEALAWAERVMRQDFARVVVFELCRENPPGQGRRWTVVHPDGIPAATGVVGAPEDGRAPAAQAGPVGGASSNYTNPTTSGRPLGGAGAGSRGVGASW
jgi:hypothetical protein